MAATDQVLVLVVMAAGMAFSAIGWAYRAGAARGIPTCFVASVVAGSQITSFGFGERRTHAWWATVGLAVLAVLLFNLSNQG